MEDLLSSARLPELLVRQRSSWERGSGNQSATVAKQYSYRRGGAQCNINIKQLIQQLLSYTFWCSCSAEGRCVQGDSRAPESAETGFPRFSKWLPVSTPYFNSGVQGEGCQVLVPALLFSFVIFQEVCYTTSFASSFRLHKLVSVSDYSTGQCGIHCAEFALVGVWSIIAAQEL